MTSQVGFDTAGNYLGSATGLSSFYGVTPVVQPVGASQTAYVGTVGTAIATTVFSEAKTGMWAFGSSTVAKTYRTRINQLRVDMLANTTLTLKLRKDLKALGLVKGLA